MLQKNRLHGLLLIAIIFMYTSLHAQKKITAIAYPYTTTVNKIARSNDGKKQPYLERAISVSPVTVINGEEIREYKGQDISTIIRSLPNVNIDRSAESTVNLRGLGTNRSLILLNGRRQPVYGQSVTYDLNNIPVEAIERVEVLKDGAGAIYGSDAVSGVINIITKDIDERIGANNTYSSYYTQPTFNFSGYKNDSYNNWTADVKGIYNITPGQSTQPDNTYGIGGSIKMNLELRGDYRVQELDFLDAGGNLRQKTTYEWYPENYRFGETYYYDCKGLKLHYNSFLTDVNGYQFEWKEEEFKNDQSTNLYRDVWPATGGNPLRIDLTPSIQLNDVIKNWKNYDVYTPATGDCKPSGTGVCDPNIFYGGISIVLEDFGPSETLTMPGGFAEYTRMVCGNFGVTGHVGYNFGSKNSVDYSKLSLLAGGNYTPFSGANCDDNFIFTTQVLLGIVNQTQKYSGNKFSDTYFTGMFGVLGNFRLSGNTGIQFGVHYNPTFAKNNTSNNFSLAGGIRINF